MIHNQPQEANLLERLYSGYYFLGRWSDILDLQESLLPDPRFSEILPASLLQNLFLFFYLIFLIQNSVLSPLCCLFNYHPTYFLGHFRLNLRNWILRKFLDLGVDRPGISTHGVVRHEKTNLSRSPLCKM
jgi:hypothetical protein